jgi:uncharacterized protein (DUF433 family)
MVAEIINRGRGPEIAGTRITVYDVLDYHKHGWHRDQIAAFFRLSSHEVQVALDYIDAHKDEVMADYQRIVERHKNYKYPPEVQAKIDSCRGIAKARLAEIQARERANGDDAEDHARS